ncbi:MAG: elongation factor Ts [Bacteroidales bacterium]|nr:elongation factor Ts [Bacteroidales bacterium]MBN2757865.1 elongation factor Ts [Bacteroidales bacterium]
MAEIKAADVAKLRKMTGAGMMDCKKALSETNGDFDLAIDILRKKGQKVASNRADREATEGAVVAGVSADSKFSAIIVLNCETDFVAKNDDFVKFAKNILNIAIEKKPASLDELRNLELNGIKIADEITNQIGVIGEKIDLSYFDSVSSDYTISYIHPGNKLATIAGFNMADVDLQVAKDVAMQIAAMNPIAVDQDGVDQSIIEKEIEIGKDQAIQEGKAVELAEKIAIGKLNKFYKESTLLNQQFVKDNKITVNEYLKNQNKNLTVTSFKRYALDV